MNMNIGDYKTRNDELQDVLFKLMQADIDLRDSQRQVHVDAAVPTCESGFVAGIQLARERIDAILDDYKKEIDEEYERNARLLKAIFESGKEGAEADEQEGQAKEEAENGASGDAR